MKRKSKRTLAKSQGKKPREAWKFTSPSGYLVEIPYPRIVRKQR